MNKVMWYAVWVRSGQEDRVLELCKTFRHYHPDAYEECFIQTYEKYRKVKGQPTKQLAHLLPGYLFFVSDHPQELQKLLKRIPEFAKTLGDDGQKYYDAGRAPLCGKIITEKKIGW